MFFFLIPVGVDYRAQRWPVVTFSLMGLCTLVHLLSMWLWFTKPEAYDWWFQTFWLTPATSPWWNYLTAIFVHADIFHLLGNMVYLFLFGACVEDLIGRGRFLIFFLVAGLMADLGHIALTPEHFGATIPMGGASGAISACMGAFALLLARTEIEFKYFGFFIFRVFAGEFFLPAWLVMSFWFLSDVFWAVIDLLQGNSSGSGVAFGAHIGGFLFGLGVMAVLKVKLRHEEEATQQAEAVIEEMAARPRPTEPEAEPMFYVSDNGQQSGPLRLEIIWKKIEDGSLSRDAFYWQEGMAQWQSIREIV